MADFLGFRPLLPAPPAAAFRFPFPAGTAGIGGGAIAAGFGAMGLNFNMALPMCHAWPAWAPAAYLGAKQHPPFLSIIHHAPRAPLGGGRTERPRLVSAILSAAFSARCEETTAASRLVLYKDAQGTRVREHRCREREAGYDWSRPNTWPPTGSGST